MKYLIIGSGMQGRACAYDLLKDPKTEGVLLADVSEKGLSAVKGWLKSPKVKTKKLDASDLAAVKRLAKGFDVTVSCVPYFFNLDLAKAAIEAGTHFIDLGGNTDIVRQELALHDRAKKRGVTVIPDNGLGPGMINTIAVAAMEKLDKTDAVLIRDGGLPQQPVPPLNYMLTFSVHGLINEYVEDATALRDFKRVAVPGLSETEIIDLPAPLGRCEAAHASGGLSTMAWTFAGKVRFMDNKLIRYPGHITFINTMRDLGFFSQDPVEVAGKKIAPRALAALLFERHFDRPGDKDLVVIRVTARGTKDGRRAEAVYDMMDFYDTATGLTAMMRTTGFPAAIVANMLASGVINKPGAYPVETGVPAQRFLSEAKKRGFELTDSFRWNGKVPGSRRNNDVPV
ncbi:MAG: saccharopine dehydrogenase NADP-binding domain-containing protein [Elusimicrobia bacterium]|nr:saccharopine dehydrogenase NADP-binding domain-containing protein [Elusimicrobiota bacterium]